MGRYTSLSSQIDKGVTPAQFFDSYKQQIAKELEIDPSTIDMTDAKWSPIVDYADPKSGQNRPMTLSESQGFIRRQPEWDKTQGAVQQSVMAADLIGKAFGKVG